MMEPLTLVVICLGAVLGVGMLCFPFIRKLPKPVQFLVKSALFLVYVGGFVALVLFMRKVYAELDVGLATGAACLIGVAIGCLLVPCLFTAKAAVVYVFMPLFLVTFVLFMVAMIILSKKVMQPEAFESSSSLASLL